ncbi:hypothetical protein BDN70DRAFT_453606 [Pholiota conissans]|uniref:Uncharacterized protein n=1 Tax=Pholiota conissans TaxID=109636 RepID=A0A9P5YNT2_9AGAR|nr:hypothetical protein BDN70DRAFT_453606 [Pholiota conissans]
MFRFLKVHWPPLGLCRQENSIFRVSAQAFERSLFPEQEVYPSLFLVLRRRASLLHTPALLFLLGYLYHSFNDVTSTTSLHRHRFSIS